MIISQTDTDFIFHELKPFLDDEQRLTKLPAKHKKQLVATYYLASKFESSRQYTELEVNEVICAWHTFFDQATFRRTMVDTGLLLRTDDCKTYWMNEEIPSLTDYLANRL